MNQLSMYIRYVVREWITCHNALLTRGYLVQMTKTTSNQLRDLLMGINACKYRMFAVRKSFALEMMNYI